MHRKMKAWSLKSSILLLILASLCLVFLATDADAACKPAKRMNKKTCNARIRQCNLEGVTMKWSGAGCTIQKKKMKDGGCQCNHYCGYMCKNACVKDKQCYWNTLYGICFVKLSNRPGLPMDECIDVTGMPTTSPVPRPSAAPTPPTTLRPTTLRPTKSPVTSKPTKSPTSSTPTKSPTTTKPSKAPTSSKPSKAPTSSKPSKAPTSRPTKKPTSSKPSKAPTRRPTAKPTSQKPSKAPTPRPTTKSPTSKAPTPALPTKSPTTHSPTTPCGTCQSGKTCIVTTCATVGELQVAMTWNRPGQARIWVYPPVTGVAIGGSVPQQSASAGTAWAAIERNFIINDVGPNNVYWPNSGERNPPSGVYKVCMDTWFFTPWPGSGGADGLPVVVTVTVTQTVPTLKTTTFSKTFTYDTYEYSSPECISLGNANPNAMQGGLVGTFTYPLP